ncbi:hypothetical protein YC2023_050633 [Brassica napus]
MFSMVRMVLSVWPSVSGWNTVLLNSLVPKASCSASQNDAVNLGSRSETMSDGTPCNFMIWSMYNSANTSTLSVSRIGNKCVTLVNLSTITHIELFDLPGAVGNPVMKSMEI